MSVPSGALRSDPIQPEPSRQTPQTGRERERARWRAPLLTSILAGIYILTLTGFARFFAPLNVPAAVGTAHLWIGVVFLVPYVAFQLPHARRVWPYRGTFHFWLGIASSVTLLITVVTGVIFPLIEDTTGLVLLAHVLLSFAFLIVLAAHLAVVATRALTRFAPGESAKVQLWAAVLIVPGSIALVGGMALVLWLFFAP